MCGTYEDYLDRRLMLLNFVLLVVKLKSSIHSLGGRLRDLRIVQQMTTVMFHLL